MLTLDAVRIEQDGFHLSADFSLAGGTCTAVLGPSGAGKSTLINAIAGFVPVAAGTISWQGRAFQTLPPAARPLSILFQDHNLLPHLTVFQNVALGLKPSLRLNQTEVGRVTAALDRVGLSGLADRKPAQLSGGQISRAGLARVLLRDRPLILLDEPFSALGPALKNDMLDLVGDIAKHSGASVMMITHAPQDACRLCPQTLLVVDGQVAGPQDTNALLADPPPALAAYLG